MKKKFFILPPLFFLVILLLLLSLNRKTLDQLLSKSSPAQTIDVLIFSETPINKEITTTVRICPHCNATNSPKSQHCIRCGRSLRRPG